MGLGLLGRGVGDIRFLSEHGAELIVTDLKSKEALASSLRQLSDLSGITFVLGEHRLSDFRQRDFILKAAGVPRDSIYIAEARRQGIPVEMSTALFVAFTSATVIGVTGTRGKSTVTHLLQAILAEHASGERVLLGGNVRGLSTLPLLDTARSGDKAVLELDSWQLQGFVERRLSPHIAVFTTFLADHMNYYKNDMDAYFADKAAIFSNQKAGDVLVVGKQVAESSYFKKYFPSHSIIVDGDIVPANWQLQLKGEHNRYNVGVALAAARECGVPDAVSRAVIEKFVGIPGRLELLATTGGISFYNDTAATTPDATLAALAALASSTLEEQKIVLIMGGADKQLDTESLIAALSRTVKALILFPGSGTDRILPMLRALAVPFVEVTSMPEAVAAAVDRSRSGDSILLSPAFASFGLFVNEFDRGDQFNQAVRKLVHSSCKNTQS